MSVTNTDTDAALASAAAVIRTLPATDLTPGEAVDGVAALEGAVPAPGSKAVSASLAGDVTGTIVIVLSPTLAEQVENGPIGPQELVAALEPALTDASAALAASFGSVHHEAALALEAEAAVGSSGGHENVTVVPINGPDGHVASLVLMLTHAAPGESSVAAPFETLSASLTGSGSVRAVELLNDVEMGVTAELGRTRMTVRELLSMQPGSVVELDRAAGSPVDLLVNGTLVARGEVVVIDEEFGVRITEIIGYDTKKNG